MTHRSRFTFAVVAILICGFVVGRPASSGPKVPKGYTYRPPNSPVRDRQQVGLVIKAQSPLVTVVNILQVDGEKIYFRLGQIGDNAPANLDYLERPAGSHTLVVTVTDRARTGPGMSFMISKPFQVTAEIEAGKEYVLWGDVYPKGWQAGVSAYDEYAVSDYAGRLAQPGAPGPSPDKWRARCEKARADIRKQIDEYWVVRDQVKVVPLAR